jgi:hypothetical protein
MSMKIGSALKNRAICSGTRSNPSTIEIDDEPWHGTKKPIQRRQISVPQNVPNGVDGEDKDS